MFLVVLLGWALARTDFVSRHTFNQMNRLSYWFGLPALLVHRIAAAKPEFGDVTGLFLAFALTTLLGILAAWAVARLKGVPRGSIGTFIQGAFRGNLAFVGLPVVLYAFAGSATSSATAESSALLTFGPAVVLYNVLAVTVLLMSADNANQKGRIRRALFSMATNPILLSCLLGLSLSLSGVALPNAVSRTLSALGQMALPLALICIGGSLHWTRVRGQLSWAAAGAAIKVALLPAAGLLIAKWMGLSQEHLRIVGILLACPTASTSYLLASQMRGDTGLASSIIVLSYLMAIPALAAVLLLTG